MAAKDKKGLLPAYLIVGEDALKRRTVLERLRKRAAEGGSLEFNHDFFDGEHASGSSIASACNTLPFASALRLVELDHAEKLGKGDIDVLCAYLTSPCTSSVLAVSAEKLAKNSRLFKSITALGKEAVIDCSPMKRYELTRALRSMAVGHGVTITDAAAEKLVSLVGEDTVRLNTELKKLALAHEGRDPITNDEVEMLVAHTSQVKPWQLVDAFSARDMRQCLRILDHVDSTPYALIGMCTNRLRELCCAKSLEARDEAGKLAKTLGVPEWRVKNHVRWSRGFTNEELRRAFTSARDCERAMKSGADPNEAFLDWMLATIA